jgi:hypothetical protein
MAENRIALIGLSVTGVTATITIALAQNTSNPMTSAASSVQDVRERAARPSARH